MPSFDTSSLFPGSGGSSMMIADFPAPSDARQYVRLPAPPGRRSTFAAGRPIASAYARASSLWSMCERVYYKGTRRPSMPVYDNILQAIGRTPLVRLHKLVGPKDAAVYAKCEFMNPGGAIKDRMALYILDKAEREGRLKPGTTIVENTSGNTGMGVALWAAVKGYRCVFTMPDKMSSEKVNALKAFVADVVVTPTNVPAEDPLSYYETAKRIHRETPGSFMLNQYHNPDNIEAHYKLTGPEIEEELRKAGLTLDAFVAGLGTGGTSSGAGQYPQERVPQSRNVGVDPEGSVYLGYFKSGKPLQPHVHKLDDIS